MTRGAPNPNLNPNPNPNPNPKHKPNPNPNPISFSDDTVEYESIFCWLDGTPAVPVKKTKNVLATQQALEQLERYEIAAGNATSLPMHPYICHTYQRPNPKKANEEFADVPSDGGRFTSGELPALLDPVKKRGRPKAGCKKCTVCLQAM